MNSQTSSTPDTDTQAMLECLRRAVTTTLERKRRLGQYAVLWKDNNPVAVGEDAPSEMQQASQRDQSER
ncbi:MAG: hypothetical protein ACU837_05710 [Gammaproteobacteria bacterium]